MVRDVVTHPGSCYMGTHTCYYSCLPDTSLDYSMSHLITEPQRAQPLNTHFKHFQSSNLSEGFSKIRQSRAGEETAEKPGPGQPSVFQVQTVSCVQLLLEPRSPAMGQQSLSMPDSLMRQKAFL